MPDTVDCDTVDSFELSSFLLVSRGDHVLSDQGFASVKTESEVLGASLLL
jgi:hypothetical protein